MQQWTRQSATCLFCRFRQSPLRVRSWPERQAQNGCGFATTSTHAKDRDRRRHEGRKREPQDNNETGNRDTRRHESRRVRDRPDANHSSKNPLIRRTSGPYVPKTSDEDVGVSLRGNIEKALNATLRRLSAETAAKEDVPGRPSTLKQLDPDAKVWPAFCERIIFLSQKPKESRDGTEATTWKRLEAAQAKGRVELDHEMYFEFLDFALKPVTRDRASGSSMPIDLRYPTEWYSNARVQQRTIHLHVGPTNSGKTYNALKKLQESMNGFYAGPLRLLAHEVYSRFRANGIPCDLVTGDDVRLDDNLDTKVYASTVEMVQLGTAVDVAVIDEIQMMANEERGWAWTRAVLGANAKEVHLCGESRVVPLIRELAASMGDTLQIHHYERLNPLRAASRSLRGNLKSLRKGDCIVAFSIMQIHALKKQIEVETGRRCAIVYGSLPPETRAEQADLFNDPDNDYDYLVASDAIGMGLNLSIKRIIFNSVSKFDGVRRVQLTVPQIKQIAGRAGRYRSAHDDKTKSSLPTAVPETKADGNVGIVTCLDEADLPVIQSALRTEAPPLRRAGIVPPAEFLEEYSQRLPVAVPFEYLLRRVTESATLHPRFFQCDVRDKLALARITDDVEGLTIEQRVNITAAPSPGRNPALAKCLRALAKVIAGQQDVDVASVPEIPLEILAQQPTADRSYLEALESLHQCLILYLWLSYRFLTNLRDRDMAMHAKHITEQKINWTLRSFSANPKLRQRLRQIRKKQEGLAEGQFSTGEPTKQEAGTAEGEARPDQPAEAYDAESGDQAEYLDVEEGRPQIGGFGTGEAELDLGRPLEPPAFTAEQQSRNHNGRTEIGLDDFFAGDSRLDIEQPNPQPNLHQQEDSLRPAIPEGHSQQAEHHDSEPLLTPTDGQQIDDLSSYQNGFKSDPADATVPDQEPSAEAGEIPTAKGEHGEVVDPTALKEEIEEGEKLRRAASG